VKEKTAHDINQLVHEYLDPASYKGTYKKLWKWSKKLDYDTKSWFKAIVKRYDTAAPVLMSDVEKRFLVQFFETTLDRLRNPDNNPGELEIRIVLPSTDGIYEYPDSNDAIHEESVVKIMHQLFKTFRKHLHLKFDIVGVYEKADDWQAQVWRESVRKYGMWMDPNLV
jgi:hypothetical protein